MSTPTRSGTSARTAASPPLVLHVTEALGGGLEDAVHDFIQSAPQYRHALLSTRRGGYATEEHLPAQVVEVVDAGRGVLALARAYRPTVRRLQPDLIHLHSAWAGLIGRVGTRGPRDARIVYSPHSYYFDRRDVSAAERLLARAAERALAVRTDLVAAVSPGEAATARRMAVATAYVPNIARLPAALRWQPSTGVQEVLVSGRIAAQKDPDFLLQVVEHARPWAGDVRWTWAGAGDAADEARLRAAGVEVTGWLPRGECLQRMSRASVYLHTAAWEGAPITLLEAAAIGTPIVARSIAALDSLGFDAGLTTPAAVADALRDVLSGTARPMVPVPPGPEDQAAAIGAAYASLVPVPPAVPQPVQAQTAARPMPVLRSRADAESRRR